MKEIGLPTNWPGNDIVQGNYCLDLEKEYFANLQ